MLDEANIETASGVNMDDRLALVPGFSLFRRSSSLAANPTTQGVSLRGLGSTGASRTLVLWDGVPLNSAFGGWVYWTRVNPDELDRVEVSQSASTSVFGDRAMGGSLGLFSPERSRAGGWVGYQGGNEATNLVEGAGSLSWANRWSASVTGRAFTTDGYFIVPFYARGPIDTPANVRFVAGSTRLDYSGTIDHLFLRFDLLAEDRDNGTKLQHNSTSLGTIAANYSRESAIGTWSLLGYHTREEYRASFSAIGDSRQTERLTSVQSVPAEATGGAAMWQKASSRWSLLAGGDFQRTEGYSLETLYPTGTRNGGGVQLQAGGFTQANVSWRRATFYGGLRGQDAGNGYAFWSPSGGIVYGLEHWRLRASGFRGFRAPTLNELYRAFRAGNALTLANPDLHPETLSGAEAGADYVSGTLRISATAFLSSLDGLITNVTRSITPSLITRQRANAASALVRGVQASVSKQWRSWGGEISWLLADSRYATGYRIPQVPKNYGSARVFWTHRGAQLAAAMRASSLQLEDDLNLYILPGYSVFQLTARQSLKKGFTLQAAFDNLFNRQYVTGYSPTPLVGSPLLWRLGISWSSW